MIPVIANDSRMFTDYRSSSVSYNQLKSKLNVRSDEEFKKFIQERTKKEKAPVFEYNRCGCASCAFGKGM